MYTFVFVWEMYTFVAVGGVMYKKFFVGYNVKLSPYFMKYDLCRVALLRLIVLELVIILVKCHKM